MSRVAMKRNKYWRCPFFKWDGATEVSCEAGRVQLPDKDTANSYMNEYCASVDWKKCTLADAMEKYYDEEKKP